MSNLITNYNVNIGGVNQDLGTIIQNTSTQTMNILTSGYTNSTASLSFDPNGQQVIYDNSIYPSMSGSSVNGNTSISFGANKRYGDNGKWVAVGNGTNTIAYSSDGINWTRLGKSILSSDGYGVAWNGTLWVAVGKVTNTIAYSYDGINWTGLGKSIFTTTGWGVAWNGTLWVAVGEGTNTIAYSYDGINWTGVTGTSASIFLNGEGIAWNGTLWVAVGSGTYTIAYSSDGKNWSPVINSKTSIFSTDCRGVSWNGTLWVAVGSGTSNSIAYSSDGINWYGSGNSIFSACLGIAWNGTLWVAVGQGATYSIAYSPDGITWSGVTGSKTNIFSLTGRGVSWNGIRFVAVGQHFSATTNIAYSSDGINWTGVTGSTSIIEGLHVAWGGQSLPNTITFPRNLTIAGGSGTTSIAYSSDGSNNWVGVSNSLNQCNGIAWNGNMWVAVGTGKSGKGPIAYSYDGSNNWLDTSSNVFTTGNGIAWNGKMWVAVGSGTNSIAYSYDGITWTDVSGSSTILVIGRGIAWNNKKWIAVGKGGTHSIANSFDGINWFGVISTFLSNTNGANAIAWNGTIWVAGGFPIVASSNQTIAYSFDGSNNWTAGTATSICTTSCKSVAWNGYKWVAGGQGGSSVATSSDGINWVGVNSTFSDCSGVTWNGTKWIAVGTLPSSKTIAYSSDGSNNWTPIANSNTIFSGGGNAVAYNQNIPSVKIQHPTIAVGSGTNTIAYSPDGITWTGLGDSIFNSESGNGVAWNGTQWIAVGSGPTYSFDTKIAYSSDGINWFYTGILLNFMSIKDVAWNGTKWIAVGHPTTWFAIGNPRPPSPYATIVYSSDGIIWTKASLANVIFDIGNGVAWNGKLWVAVGQGTNYSIAYSSDGINWRGVPNSKSNIFSTGNGIAWNGTRWVAVGYLYDYESQNYVNSIAYSPDGITWFVGMNIFNEGRGVAWNGTIWVAVGNGTNTIAYSSDGINWTGLGNSIFSDQGNGVAWNGLRFVAVGSGTNSIAYSSNGITWTAVTNSTNIFSSGNGVAGNPKVGPVIVPSAIHLNNNINSNTLTFSNESYYQSGVNNISIDVNTM